MRWIFLILICIVGVIFVCGCTGSSSSTVYNPIEKVLPKPEIHVNTVNTDSGWSFSKGCYFTAKFQVYNSGDGTAKNVQLNVQLLDSNNVISDSKQVFVGTLAPGSSNSVSVVLDGDCSKSYRVKASPSYDS